MMKTPEYQAKELPRKFGVVNLGASLVFFVEALKAYETLRS